MRVIQFLFLLIARLFLSLIFILSSLNNIFNWQSVETDIVNRLIEWHSYVDSDALRSFFSTLLPWVPLLLVSATILEFIGAIFILFGIKPKFGAFLLILFLIPATIFLHQFWFLEGALRDLQIALFLKNTAIIGGLLYVLIFGSRVKEHGIRFPISKDFDETS